MACGSAPRDAGERGRPGPTGERFSCPPNRGEHVSVDGKTDVTFHSRSRRRVEVQFGLDDVLCEPGELDVAALRCGYQYVEDATGPPLEVTGLERRSRRRARVTEANTVLPPSWRGRAPPFTGEFVDHRDPPASCSGREDPGSRSWCHRWPPGGRLPCRGPRWSAGSAWSRCCAHKSFHSGRLP